MKREIRNLRDKKNDLEKRSIARRIYEERRLGEYHGKNKERWFPINEEDFVSLLVGSEPVSFSIKLPKTAKFEQIGSIIKKHLKLPKKAKIEFLKFTMENTKIGFEKANIRIIDGNDSFDLQLHYNGKTLKATKYCNNFHKAEDLNLSQLEAVGGEHLGYIKEALKGKK